VARVACKAAVAQHLLEPLTLAVAVVVDLLVLVPLAGQAVAALAAIPLLQPQVLLIQAVAAVVLEWVELLELQVAPAATAARVL
jgi:hypothetical protein